MNKNLTRRKNGRVKQAQDLLPIKQNLKVRLKFWGFEYFYIGIKGLKNSLLDLYFNRKHICVWTYLI